MRRKASRNRKYRILSRILKQPYMSLLPRQIYERQDGNTFHSVEIIDCSKGLKSNQ